jgi:hypothetical protein
MSVRSPQRGGATVETAGLLATLAAAMLALVVWMQANADPPAEPPPLLDAAVAPLEDAPRITFPVAGPGAQPWWTYRGDGLEPAPRLLLRLGERHRAVFADNADAFMWAFAQGVAERTEEEVLAIIRDPAGEVIDVIVVAEAATTAPTDPRTFVRAVEQAEEIRNYVVSVYTEGEPREASRRVGRDAGRLTAEIVVGRAKRLAARKLRERLGKAGRDPRERSRDGSERHP